MRQQPPQISSCSLHYLSYCILCFKRVLWQSHWKEKCGMKIRKLHLKLQVTKEYEKNFKNLKGAMAR